MQEHLENYLIKEVEAHLDDDGTSWTSDTGFGRANKFWWEHPQTKTLYCAQCLRVRGTGHDPDLHY